MKAKRLLFLVMAICLASGVKAQFYDEADDIYYYVKEYDEREEVKQIYWMGHPTLNFEKTGKIVQLKADDDAMILNFDGKQAAILGNGKVSTIKEYLQKSSSYYEDKIETVDYNLNYSSSSYKNIVKNTENEWRAHSTSSSWTVYENNSYRLIFSPDRNILIEDRPPYDLHYYKRVDKSFFKVGRSRTPSSTMHE